MPDREKIKKGLDVCLKNIDQPDCPNDCPYLSDCSKYENRVVFQPLMRDALALLKEQDAVEPKWASGIKGVADALCGSCMAWLSDHSWGYCPRCGKAVKWE